MFTIVPYADALHRNEMVALWQAVFGYEAAHNAPPLAIDKKRAVDDGLFFVALTGAPAVSGPVSGSIMAGYDGHRGWLYAVAVHPDHRQRGLGAALVRHAEQALTARGCMKINLQLADGNEAVAGFYQRLGYAVEPRTSMGKVIAANVHPAPLQPR